MDDPWGSPWVSDANDPPSQLAPSASESTERRPDAPPSVFLSAPPVAFSLPGSQSPWTADDDSFGNWNTADPAPSPGWGGSAWETAGATTPRAEHSRKESLAAWPRSASPGQAALVLPHSAGTSRQPSPDPWAAERFDRSSPSKPISPLPSLESFSSFALPSSVSDDEHTITKKDIADTRDEEAIGRGSGDTHEASENTQAERPSIEKSGNEWRYETTLDSAVSTNDRLPDAHSASSSDSGFDEPEGGASPDTSGAEEHDDGPSERKRAHVSKVRGLVDMYDGLARKKDYRPPLEPRRTVSGRVIPPEDDAEAHASRPEGEDEVDVHDEAAEKESESLHTRSRTNSRVRELASSIDSSETTRVPSRNKTNVSFVVDTSLVDKLFPDLPLPGDPIIPSDDIPDQIPADSFGAISERKLWYRLSRFGSSRKHDSGAEDDNYTRVAWPTSAVRRDVLVIVRRWMEEDSLGLSRSARGALGAGTARGGASHMFGWDSSAAPVELDAVFRRKGTVEVGRVPGGVAAPRQVAPSGGKAARMAPPTAVASFGWSSPVAAAAPVAPALRDFGTAPVAVKGPVTAPLAAAPVSLADDLAHGSKSNKDDADDDDEWGDMVTSAQGEPPTTWNEMSTDPTLSLSGMADRILFEAKAASPEKLSDAAAPASSIHNSLIGGLSGSSTTSILTEPVIPKKSVGFADDSALHDLALVSQMGNSARTPQQQPAARALISLPLETPAPLADALGGASDDASQQAESAVVRGIVAKLADLSYMLR